MNVHKNARLTPFGRERGFDARSCFSGCGRFRKDDL